MKQDQKKIKENDIKTQSYNKINEQLHSKEEVEKIVIEQMQGEP